jgi:hypothetical protein
METTSAAFDFAEIAKQFPFVQRRALYEIGQIAGQDFYKNYGRGIFAAASTDSRGMPLSRRNSRMVSYSVDKNGNYVKVSSFPLNILRYGGARTAKRTAGRKIMNDWSGGFNVGAAALQAMGGIISDIEEVGK